jgi:glutathione S-transferase
MKPGSICAARVTEYCRRLSRFTARLDQTGTSDFAIMLTIHNFARGARGLRAMWLCEEMNLPYAVRNHPYPTGADYRALNPLGSVPLLEDDNGIGLSESIAIMLYVAHAYGPTPLLPSDHASLAKCLQLTVFSETELGANMNALLAAKFGAGEADKRNWSVRGLEQRVERALAHVETLIGASGFLVGGDITLADIAVSCTFAMWRGGLGKPLSGPLSTWQDRLRSRPAYQRAWARSEAAPA